MNELALFAGTGGGILGGFLLGWRTVCAVEADPFRRSILIARQRDGILKPFPIWDDVRTFNGRQWRGQINVISGGFPCQPFSGASRGRRVAPDLWPEMRRIVEEVESPCVFAENVDRKAILKAGEDLRALGYRVRCGRVSAAALGAPHRRIRFWVVANAHGNGEPRLPVDAKVARASSLAPDFWRTKPDASIVGVDDGLAARVDRLAALGDGQVPSVAALAWEVLNVWQTDRTDCVSTG